MTLFDIDIADAALQKRGGTLPANIQYAWPHPSKRFLHGIVSSNGGWVWPATKILPAPSASIRRPAP